MQRIPQVLKFPVIIQSRRASVLKLQSLQEFDFLLGDFAAKGLVAQELFKAGFNGNSLLAFLFGKLKSLPTAGGESAIELDFHVRF